VNQSSNYISATTVRVYKVISNAINEVISHGEINNIDKRNNRGRLCCILLAYSINRNNGCGEKVINELPKIAFDELKLHRVDLYVFDFNKPAISCYKKCRSKIEDLLRESFVIDNKYVSIYNMNILQSKW